MTPDAELLRRYAETDSQEAFAELVRRHLDLVYSAALRQVNGDAHLAQDVAQSVFADLARKAAPLSRHAVLTGWLYTSAFFAAAKAARSESRRHAHEQEAQLMRELLDNPASDLDWQQLRPVLDAAMHDLRESDREAILLRFFENRPLAEVGARLGLSENAARMRVDRALEKLRALLTRRGLTTAAAALSTVISTHAVQLAPAGLAGTLAASSLASVAAGTGSTLTFLKIIAMNKLSTALVGVALVAGLITPLVVQQQTRTQLRSIQETARLQADQVTRLNAENSRLTNLIALTASSNRLPNEQWIELLKLRNEVGILREAARQPESPKPAPVAVTTTEPAKSVDRVTQLKERLEAMPKLKIPELQFLIEEDWEVVASTTVRLETDQDYRIAFGQLRQRAKIVFSAWIGQALHSYADNHRGQMPKDLLELKPYFKPPVNDAYGRPFSPPRYQLLAVDDMILQRYKLVYFGRLSDVPLATPPSGGRSNRGRSGSLGSGRGINVPWTAPLVVEADPVDPDYDTLFSIGSYGFAYQAVGSSMTGGFGAFARRVPNGLPELIIPAVNRRPSVSGGSGGGVVVAGGN